jgi:hypothetical protein
MCLKRPVMRRKYGLYDENYDGEVCSKKSSIELPADTILFCLPFEDQAIDHCKALPAPLPQILLPELSPGFPGAPPSFAMIERSAGAAPGSNWFRWYTHPKQKIIRQILH